MVEYHSRSDLTAEMRSRVSEALRMVNGRLSEFLDRESLLLSQRRSRLSGSAGSAVEQLRSTSNVVIEEVDLETLN